MHSLICHHFIAKMGMVWNVVWLATDFTVSAARFFKIARVIGVLLGVRTPPPPITVV